MRKILKPILSAMLFLILLACTITAVDKLNAKAETLNTYDFLNISESESLNFIEEFDIEVPVEIRQSSDFASITQNLIKLSASSRDYRFVYNYGAMQTYAEEIQEVVKRYAVYDDVSLLSSTAYELQYNTVKNDRGEWVTSGGAYDARWANYNCYAYAINRIEQPNFYSTSKQYQPGDMSNSGGFSLTISIADLANVIKNDLLAMGYCNVLLSTAVPSVDDGQELICVRRGDSDYHFMHYDSETNAWYHKLGYSAVLKYNSVPNNSDIWYGESSSENGESKILNPFTLVQISYDSTIYYIKYDVNDVAISDNTSNLSYALNVQAKKDSILQINNSSYSKYYSFSINATNSFEAELYDDEMELVESYEGTSVQFYKSLVGNVYYLKLNYSSVRSSGNINIVISAHAHTYSYTSTGMGHTASCSVCGYTITTSHTYSSHYCTGCGEYTTLHDYDRNYSWVDGTQHSVQCSCGDITTQPHAVRSGRTICLLCGGRAIIGLEDFGPQSLTYVSQNGSYILQSGVVVLVEEDVTTYLEGKLIFYRQDSLPNVA